ncbi:MAG: hypothetical protein WAL48_09005, partial [Xanthobacteraceae bacterium]
MPTPRRDRRVEFSDDVQVPGIESGFTLNNLIEQNFVVFFPLFFASLWLAITTVLAVFSGWFRLMARFPNQTESPLLRIRGQSGSMGSMGGVSMHGIL